MRRVGTTSGAHKSLKVTERKLENSSLQIKEILAVRPFNTNLLYSLKYTFSERHIDHRRIAKKKKTYDRILQ